VLVRLKSATTVMKQVKSTEITGKNGKLQ